MQYVHTFRRVFRAMLILQASLFLSACESTLLFGERTGFNLGIQVNDDPATPLNVNAGLERSVAAVVPPGETEGDGTGQAKGEAVNLFSGFKLEYDENDTSVFGGTLTIRTQFASGAAANAVADGEKAPEAVAKIMNVRGTFSDSMSVDRMRRWLTDLGEPALAELREWRDRNHPGVDLTLLRYAREFESLRVEAIEDLNIP